MISEELTDARRKELPHLNLFWRRSNLGQGGGGDGGDDDDDGDGNDDDGSD